MLTKKKQKSVLSKEDLDIAAWAIGSLLAFIVVIAISLDLLKYGVIHGII